MRVAVAFGAAAMLAMSVATAAAEVESGLPEGAKVKPFQVVKKGGVEDGVKVDKALCYR